MAPVLLQTTAVLSLLSQELVGSDLPERAHPRRTARIELSAPHEDRGSRIEDRVNSHSSIFGPRSSIFDLRSLILDPRSHHRDSPFVTGASLTTGRHLLALVRGTCSTSSILTSRPGRLAVTMFSICRRLSSPNPFFGAIMNWTE